MVVKVRRFKIVGFKTPTILPMILKLFYYLHSKTALPHGPEYSMPALWLPPLTNINLISERPLPPSLIGFTLPPRVSTQTKLFLLVT